MRFGVLNGVRYKVTTKSSHRIIVQTQVDWRSEVEGFGLDAVLLSQRYPDTPANNIGVQVIFYAKINHCQCMWSTRSGAHL